MGEGVQSPLLMGIDLAPFCECAACQTSVIFLSLVSVETFLPKILLDTLAGMHVVFHIDSERVFV